MEFTKTKNGKRWMNYSGIAIPKPHKQKHVVQIVLAELENNKIELGFQVNVVEDNFGRVQFTTTDVYEITQKGNEVNYDKIEKAVFDTFQIVKSIYNENKTSLWLVEPLQYSLSDEMPQILRELTHILNDTHQSSTHGNHSH